MLWRSVPKDILVSRSTQHLGGRKPFMHIFSLLPTPQQLHTNVSIMGSRLGHCQGRLRPHQRARRARSPAMPPARYERALDAVWIQRWYMRSRKMRYLQNYLVPAPSESMRGPKTFNYTPAFHFCHVTAYPGLCYYRSTISQTKSCQLTDPHNKSCI